MPCSSQYFIKVVEVYSPPLSDRRALMCLSVAFSTIILNFLNTSKASDFSFRKYTQVFLEKSSMKDMKYLLPLKDSGVIGPHMSVWINSRICLAWYYAFLGNEVFVCLPNTHSSQNFPSNSTSGSPCTIFFFANLLSPSWCRWPNQRCHMDAWSSILTCKHFSWMLLEFNLYIQFLPITTWATRCPDLSFKCRLRSSMRIE